MCAALLSDVTSLHIILLHCLMMLKNCNFSFKRSAHFISYSFAMLNVVFTTLLSDVAFVVLFDGVKALRIAISLSGDVAVRHNYLCCSFE